jgi:hypothetical protein
MSAIQVQCKFDYSNAWLQKRSSTEVASREIAGVREDTTIAAHLGRYSVQRHHAMDEM